MNKKEKIFFNLFTVIFIAACAIGGMISGDKLSKLTKKDENKDCVLETKYNSLKKSNFNILYGGKTIYIDYIYMGEFDPEIGFKTIELDNNIIDLYFEDDIVKMALDDNKTYILEFDSNNIPTGDYKAIN